jgi:hypothetical protein
MRRWVIACTCGGLALLVAVPVYWMFRPSAVAKDAPAKPPPARAAAVETASLKSSLPETDPPPGLSIIPYGKRDFFPVIRKPWYVTAKNGDALLDKDESVLGLIIGTEVRAYSTNQLTDHEMVLDEIAGVPVLVTY